MATSSNPHAPGRAVRTTRAAALSRLGLFALSHPDVGTVMAEAVRVARDTLQTDLCAMLERAPSGDFFYRRAESYAHGEVPRTQVFDGL